MKFYRGWRGVDALSFDLDDTLYNNHPVIRRAEQQLQLWLAARLPQTTAFHAETWLFYQQRVVADNPMLVEHVTEKRRAVLARIALDCGLDEQRSQQLADDAMRFFLAERSNFKVPSQSMDLLERLARRYPLVAITNGNVDCESLKLTPYFVDVLKAGFDGRAKPHPDLFAKAKQRLGLPAERILHIGDSLSTDVAGAKRANFKACWFNEKDRNIAHNSQLTMLPDIEIRHIEELLKL